MVSFAKPDDNLDYWSHQIVEHNQGVVNHASNKNYKANYLSKNQNLHRRSPIEYNKRGMKERGVKG